MRSIIIFLVIALTLFFSKFSKGKEFKKLIIIKPSSMDILYWINDLPTVHADIIRYAYSRIGTPYRYGGASWTKGIDCSNFTWRLYADLRYHYREYVTTYEMQRIKKEYKGLRAIPLEDAKAGDLLVYGRFGKESWKGHVVALVNEQDEIVVGSHSGHGVQFVRPDEYPCFFGNYPLVKVLRVIQ